MGFLAIAVLYSTSLFSFYNTWEPRVEATLLAFLVLSWLAYFEWRKKRKFIYLLISALFLGFSMTIKVVAGFAALAMLVIYLYDLFFNTNKKQIVKNLSTSLLAVLVAILVMAPWIFIHLQEHHWQHIHYSDLIWGSDDFIVNRGNLLQRARVKNLDESIFTGIYEDFSRYEGYETGWFGLERFLPKNLAQIPIARYISLPWDVTMLQNRSVLNLHITSLFLVLLPLLLLAWFLFPKTYQKLNMGSKAIIVSLYSITYVLAWVIGGKGGVWYGIGMFAGLSILLALLIDGSRAFPKIHKTIMWLVVINCLFCLLIDLKRYGHSAQLYFATGKLDREQMINATLTNHLAMATVINTDPEIVSGQKYVLMVGGYLHYFIDDYFHRVIADNFLDQFNGLYEASDGNYQAIASYLKKAGIKYIVYNLNTEAKDQTIEKSLVKKNQRFINFAGSELEVINFSKERSLVLFKVK
ncbi:glycosyltransferase family 39 protein [Candidatus Beckwithbacteria bacterium]|nr:glycosyltransferase family 39 protein [Candidatus Beckwithbacteria bacterium]